MGAGRAVAGILAASRRAPHGRVFFLSTLGRDHDSRPELLPDVGVIPFTVELGVRSYQSDGSLLGSPSTTAGKVARSFQGPCRAIYDSRGF